MFVLFYKFSYSPYFHCFWVMIFIVFGLFFFREEDPNCVCQTHEKPGKIVWNLVLVILYLHLYEFAFVYFF